MIIGCNNEITEVHYSGYTIDKIYACGGQLVYEATPSFGGKFKLTLLDESTVSAECDATSAITAVEILPQYSGSVVSAEIGNCVTTIDDGAFESCSALTSVSISDSVTSIVKYAFNNCRNLTNVNIPSGVTVLTEGVFHRCTSLTSITIPDSVTSIGSSTFGYCISLTGITIPDSVTTIYNNAFSSCYNLTSITIPDSVTSIDNYAFSHCTGLTSITVEATTPPTLGGTAFEDTNNCPIYVPCESIEAYKSAWSEYESRLQCIPTPFEGKYRLTLSDTSVVTGECGASSAVTQAEISAYTTTLNSAEIGDCVTSISNYAFYGCSGLTSVNIPSSVTSIGWGAFDSCSSLTNIVIPNSVTTIGGWAFEVCTSLTSFTIPSGVTSIGEGAFFSCSRLNSITVNAATPPTLGTEAFYNTNNCPIYVPAESVDAYKAAWTAHASRIQAIP